MIVFLLILVILISLGLNVATCLIIRNLLKKIDTYESWILEFKEDVINTLADMRDIDKSGVFATAVNPDGVFESDDQVGQNFKAILDVIEKLNERTR